jgi:hypothetical protein
MFSAFFNRSLNYFEGMYFSHRDGILMRSSWGKIERTISDLFAYPGVLVKDDRAIQDKHCRKT